MGFLRKTKQQKEPRKVDWESLIKIMTALFILISEILKRL